MASTGLSTCTTSKPPLVPRTSAVTAAASSSSSPSASHRCRSSLVFRSLGGSGSFVAALSKNCSRGRRRQFVVCMAPDEEKLTRRNPLDFPIEWERPKPGRRPDIFPQFSPMKAPIPPPLPYDPPEEDEEEEEKKKEEEEEDPEKEEEPDKPEKQ